jgi:peptide/nickel transport system substrate-binding protein
MGYRYAIYETLVQVNEIDAAAKPQPWLATEWKWNTDYTQIDFTIRQNVKWSDGQPLTPDDVAYSIGLLKDNDALNTNALPFKDVTVNGNDVTVTFTRNVYVQANAVYQMMVVPKHLWENQDPTKWTNQKPVGSGPYTLTSWTAAAVNLTANPNYWGGKPKVDKIRYIEYNDNTSLTNALVTGQVDAAYVYIPNYKTTFLAKNPKFVGWFPSTVASTMLWTNDAKGPFSDVNLRKAASMVLDRQQISLQGSTGADAPIQSVTGLPGSGESFIADSLKGQNFKVDVDGAKKILTDAGYTGVGQAGALKDPKGNPVTISLTDPASYSNKVAELQIVKTDLEKLGMTVNLSNPTADVWTQDLNNGNFDATLRWTDGGTTPYNMYMSVMGESYYKPIGQAANNNFGRFQSKEASDALDAYAAATTDAERATTLETVEKIFVDQMPAIPMFQSSVWGNYSNVSYTGWPSESNPYTSINWTTPAETLMFTKMTPVK